MNSENYEDIDLESHILVDQGILGNFKSASFDNGDTGNYLKISGDDQAENLFNFLATNTSVEWTLVQYGTNSDYIATTHQAGYESEGYRIAYNLIAGGTFVRNFDHDHPGFLTIAGPSGCFMNDQITLNSAERGELGGDIRTANALTNANSSRFPNNTIIFNVFDITTRQIIQYDSQNILNYQPWP